MKAEDLVHVSERTDQLEAPAGQVLYFEGDAARFFFTIRRGVVRLVRSFPDGRRSVVGFLHAGDFFGGGFRRDVYDATVEAITPLEYCRIGITDLNELTEEFPELNRQLASMAADRLHAADDHIVLLSRKTAIEKVAAFLLASAEWTGKSSDFALPMARSDIADYLGLTIETVSRTMTRLIDHDIIELPTPQRVMIVDWPALKSLACPEAS